MKRNLWAALAAILLLTLSTSAVLAGARYSNTHTIRYQNQKYFLLTQYPADTVVRGTLGIIATAEWRNGAEVEVGFNDVKAWWVNAGTTTDLQGNPGSFNLVSSSSQVSILTGPWPWSAQRAQITQTWVVNVVALQCDSSQCRDGTVPVTLYASMTIDENGNAVGRRWHHEPTDFYSGTEFFSASGWDIN